MVKNGSIPKMQLFLFIIHSNVLLENLINSKQVLSPLSTILHIRYISALVSCKTRNLSLGSFINIISTISFQRYLPGLFWGPKEFSRSEPKRFFWIILRFILSVEINYLFKVLLSYRSRQYYESKVLHNTEPNWFSANNSLKTDHFDRTSYKIS